MPFLDLLFPFQCLRPRRFCSLIALISRLLAEHSLTCTSLKRNTLAGCRMFTEHLVSNLNQFAVVIYHSRAFELRTL